MKGNILRLNNLMFLNFKTFLSMISVTCLLHMPDLVEYQDHDDSHWINRWTNFKKIIRQRYIKQSFSLILYLIAITHEFLFCSQNHS